MTDLSKEEYEKKIRPLSFKDFRGQNTILSNLQVFVKAAIMRKEPLDHLLLHGPPGLGKTTLANIVSSEMQSNIKTTSGPVLDKAGDLAGILTNLEEINSLPNNHCNNCCHNNCNYIK